MAPDIPELAIAVLPDYQQRGIGKKLLQALLKSASIKLSLRGICLSCRTDNPAYRLYEKMGFTKVLGSEVENRVGGTSVSMVQLFSYPSTT